MKTSPRCWPGLLLLLGGCAALGLSVLFAQQPDAAQEAAADDPVPLRRVLMTPDRVRSELDKARGVLRQLPYAEFQARVKAAARGRRQLKNPPRLTEASYSASLNGQALVGNGEWTVFNPGPAGILRLPDLNLALKKAQFKQAAAAAILGDLDGQSLGLLINGPGKHAVVFDWSARAEPAPEGLHFKLRLPPCPVASLDLTLANDRLVSLLSRTSGAVTRLYQGKTQTRWQIRFSGRSEVDLVIHQTSGPQPLVLARLHTDQELIPNRLSARFRFHMQVLHHLVRKLYLECDAGLTPYDIRIRGAELRWKFYPARKPADANLLVIELTEPVLDPLRPLPPFSVHCFGPLDANRPWTCPGLRLLKVLPWGGSSADEPAPPDLLADPRLVPAFPQRETLRLQVHPDLQLENWQAGGFRLQDTRARPDRSHVLTLVGRSGPMSGEHESRPSARVKMQQPECLARQYTWWQIQAEGATLETQLTYELARGRLFQLRLGLPRGWEVDQVKLGDANELSKNWVPLEENQRPLLVIDLQKPLAPQTPLSVMVRLRAASRNRLPANGLDFPDIEPLQAQFRSGGLAITVDPRYRVQVSRPGTAVVDDTGNFKLPWGTRTPDLYYPFRIRKAAGKAAAALPRPALSGKLVLRPRAARIRARCVTEVVLARDRASAEVRLQLSPEFGNPRRIYLHLSAPVAGSWPWRVDQGVNQIDSLVPVLPELLALETSPALHLVPLLTGSARGQWWRLTLARPLHDRLTLRTSIPLSASSGPGNGREIPLLTVPAADALDGEVTLYLADAELVEVKSAGLTEVPAATKDGADHARESAVPWRSYRYRSAQTDAAAGQYPRLALGMSRQPPAGRFTADVIDEARLTTYVEPSGRLLNHLAFQARNWRRRSLTVRLPGQVQLLAVRAYGLWTRRAAWTNTPEGIVVQLPVVSGRSQHPFEIVYASEPSTASWMLWLRVESAAPVFPVRPLAWGRCWRLPPDVAPLDRGSYHRLPGAGTVRGFPSFDPLLALATRLQAGLSSAGRDQQRFMEEAAAGLAEQYRGGKRWRLGETLGRLIFDHLKAQAALVLDVQALRLPA